LSSWFDAQKHAWRFDQLGEGFPYLVVVGRTCNCGSHLWIERWAVVVGGLQSVAADRKLMAVCGVWGQVCRMCTYFGPQCAAAAQREQARLR